MATSAVVPSGDIFDQIHAQASAAPPPSGDIFDKLHSLASPTKRPVNISPEVDKATSIGPTFVKDSIDNAADLAPVAGGAIGSVGGPGGAMLGAGIGGLAARGLHRAYNGETGADDLGGMAKDFSMNAALQGAGELIPPVVGGALRKGGQSIADLLFSGGGKVDADAVGKAIEMGLKPTTAQTTGNPIANILENALAGKAKIAREIEQTGKLQIGQEGLSRDVSGEPPIGPTANPASATRGALSQTAVKGNLQIAKDVEKQAYDKFEQTHLVNNTQNFNTITGYEESPVVGSDGKPIMRPIVESKTIAGPIYTPNATSFANQIKPQLDEFLKGDTYQVLPDSQKDKIAALSSTVDNLAQGTHVLGADGKEMALPLKDYQTVKQMITNLNSSVGSVVDPNLQQGGLQKLASLLDKDRDLSIANWQNGTAATSDLEKAKAATQYRKQTFNDEVTNKVFSQDDRRLPADPSQFFSEAYKSPEKAQRLMQAMGPGNAKYIKGDYFDNVIGPKLFDSAEGKFTPDNLVRELNDPNSVSRTIYSADERSAMLDFAKAAQAVNPAASNIGKYVLAFNNGRMLLRLGAATGGAVLGHVGAGNALAGAAGGIGLEVAASDFAKNILLNPSYARNAARMVKIPVDSAESAARSKLMLAGLKGAQVLVNRNDGSAPQSGMVTDGGKIKLDH